MKILFLNIWGGRAGSEKLLNFIESHKDTLDVFCFQEVWSAPYEHAEGVKAGGREIRHENIMVQGLQEISRVLPNHEYFFHPHYLDNYGLMMFVKRGINVFGSGDVFVYKEKGYVPEGDIGKHARNIQYVIIEYKNAPLTVINFHGLWNGKGKEDSEERLLQSENILKFIDGLDGGVVLGGDFNLLPETQSIKVFEEHGLQNLIKEHGIISTRTKYYDKPYSKFADYVFVSKDVGIKDFIVLADEVSDHSPLLLEIG